MSPISIANARVFCFGPNLLGYAQVQRARLERLRFSPEMSFRVDRALAWADRMAAANHSTKAIYSAADAYATAAAHLLAGHELDHEGKWGPPVVHQVGASGSVGNRRQIEPAPPKLNRHQRRAEAARRGHR